MQLTIKIRPFYENDLKATYPKLDRHLNRIDPNWAMHNPSLYSIAERLDILLYRADGTPFREVLLKHRETLHKLYVDITERVADWRLAEADQLMYAMEDLFDDIEHELTGVPDHGAL
jgi:hypothetical protein